MKRLGPAVVLVVVALAAVRAAAQEEQFIPEEAKINVCGGHNTVTSAGDFAGVALLGTVASLMLSVLALTVGMYDEARGLGRFCLGCGVLTFCCAGMENSLNPAVGAWEAPWGRTTFAISALAAAMGWCVQQIADRRLVPYRGRRAESADAIRRANRRRGVTLPDARSDL